MTIALAARLSASNSGPPVASAPAIPTSLSVTAQGGYNRIFLTWLDGARTSTITVERSPDDSTWATVATVKHGVQQFQDGALTPGTQYYYRLTGVNMAGSSAPTSSDNDTVYSPQTELPSPMLILESDSGLLQASGGSSAIASNDPVGEWQDQSGGSLDFTQATGGNKPSLQFVREIPVVRFNSNDFLSNAGTWTALHDGSAYTVVIVYRTTDNADAIYGLMGDNGASSGHRGMAVYWDNRAASPAVAQLNHQISTGSATVYLGTQQGIAPAQEFLIAEASFHHTDGGMIYVMGDFKNTAEVGSESGSAATYAMQLGANGNNVFPLNGDVLAVYVSTVVLSDDQRGLLRQYLNSKYPTAFGVAGDMFLTADQVERSTVAPLPIQSLTKYVSNPVLPVAGTNTDTWDHDKNYGSEVMIDSTHFYKFYSGIDSSGNFCVCYATSGDDISWTKPNLGLNTYGGNTNNNILLLGNGFYDTDVVIYTPDLPSDQRYLLLTAHDNTNRYGSFLQKAAAPLTGFASMGAVTLAGDSNHNHEAHSMVYDPLHQNVVIYNSNGHGGDKRYIGAQRGNTPGTADGGWHDIEFVINNDSTTEQKYSINVTYANGWYLGLVDIYNSSTQEIFRTDLYASKNPFEWVLVKEGVLEIGGSGSFDEHMLLSHTGRIEVGNEWRFPYAGSPFHHDHFAPGVSDDNRIGYAAISAEGFGGRGGVGPETTQLMYLPPSESLYGTVKVTAGGTFNLELQDSTGAPITNYAAADFDTITTDEFGIEFTWGGNPAPDDSVFKLHIVYDESYLNDYHAE